MFYVLHSMTVILKKKSFSSTIDDKKETIYCFLKNVFQEIVFFSSILSSILIRLCNKKLLVLFHFLLSGLQRLNWKKKKKKKFLLSTTSTTSDINYGVNLGEEIQPNCKISYK